MAKKRELSDFLARELLYDYVTGNLDDERRVAVEECIRGSEDVAQDLKALTEGIKYCENLRNTKLSEPLFVLLNEPAKTIKDHAKSWKRVKPGIRYAIEALLVAFVIGVSVMFIPKKYRVWENDGKYTVVESRRAESTPSETGFEATTSTTFLEVAKNDVETSVKQNQVFGPVPPPEKLNSPPGKTQTTLQVSNTQTAARVTTTTLAVTSTTVAKVPVVETAKAPSDAKRKGELYRVYIYSDRVDEWTPQFTKKIVELGGQKAGEVQLGWRRKQGSYFHFSLPESKYDELKNFLQTFGPVRIVKEAHPRIMPEGQIRLILWLEEISTEKNSADGEPKAE